ncbi:uncharacterized protein LOC133733613 [Rosa rugosa]|uniref:uncharacterized protein LOC133733613 n=1 Tax=Rosa rugosa TaxID=74645 RepID=UPI002B41707C|nr:uncharacterized protein LOC133733613 [Rosa rugosa]
MEEIRTSEQSKPLYQSLRDGDVLEVVKACAKATTLEARLKLIPTVHDDTILHIAIYMRQESIAMKIIEISSGDNDELITKRNQFGNTALHEAAATDFVRVVEKLLEKAPELLSIPNKKGEMPLYTAAHFGQKRIFKLLAEKLKNNDDLCLHLCSLYPSYVNPVTKSEKYSYDPEHIRSTILHAAIHAEFFELALFIARKPEYAKNPKIVQLKDENSKTPLQLLSSNSSAFESGMKCGLIKRFIYYCAPYENAKEEEAHVQNSSDDSHVQSSSRATLFLRRVISSVHRSVWIVLREWRTMEKIHDERKRHGLALELAKFLIAEDFSWDIIMQQSNPKKVAPSQSGTPDIQQSNPKTKAQSQSGNPDIQQPNPKTKAPSQSGTPDIQQSNPKTKAPDIPLFIATSNGILEIVEETLRVYPSSLEYTNKEKQNILHLAIMHRQSHIFDRVMTKRNDWLTSRLTRETDKNGFTILHYVGLMEFYKGGTQPGPALQLQEELEWYEKVKKSVPRYFAMNRSSSNEQKETLEEFYDRKYKETVKELSENVDKIIPPKSVNKLGLDESKEETPREYFGRTHGELLEEAQEWLERTSNSCSLVAGLIASVAFAAAFTIPGGNNGRNGQPILIDSPFFLVFIITDALSIASSLTSLAMFLSILSSPYELDDFLRSLPRKLILGFTSLFFSVAVTSLTFASTMMLTIPMKKRLTTTLIYCVAVLPVTMSALLQHPLWEALKRTGKSSVKVVTRILPSVPWPLIETACSKATKAHTS